MLKRIINKWRSLRYYVVADPADNSVTLSKRLFRHITMQAEREGVADASVFVFRVKNGKEFGFMAGHGVEESAGLCRIQYNGKYKCVGFQTLCPSVGRIFFDYGLPALKPARLSVSVKKTGTGKTFYLIDIPSKKLVRKCEAYSETHGSQI